MLLTALLAAGCAGSPESATTSSAATGPPIAASTSSPTSTASPLPPSTTEVPPTTTQPQPAAPVPDSLPPLLVADTNGVRVITAGAAGPVFVEGRQVVLAVPDLLGGVVFQGPQPEPTGLAWDEGLGRNVFLWEEGGPEAIWHVAAPGAEPAVIVTHPDARLTLVDVVRIGGRPNVLYRMYVGGPQVNPVWDIVQEWLCLHDLEAGETTILGLVGGYESSFNRLRFGGDVVVLTHEPYGESAGDMIGFGPLSDIHSAPEDEWLPGLFSGRLDYGPGLECMRHWDCVGRAIATVASDGSRVSWVEARLYWDETTIDPSTQFMAVDPTTGEELLHVELAELPQRAWEEPGGHWFIDDDGSFAVISRVFDDVFVVGPDGDVGVLALPGAVVSFWET